jgi:hypothetical protein
MVILALLQMIIVYGDAAFRILVEVYNGSAK